MQNNVGVLSVFECTVRPRMSKFWAAASFETIPATNSKSEFVTSPFGFLKDTSLFWMAFGKDAHQRIGLHFLLRETAVLFGMTTPPQAKPEES